MMDEIVKVIVPSYQRPSTVQTIRAVANCTLCVTASEEAQYRRNYPNTPLMVHPDEVYGYLATMQWIMDEMGGGDFFIIDDDIKAVQRKYITAGERGVKLTPETAYDLIQCTALMAQEMGAYMFGYSPNPNPLTYHGFKPFRFTGFIVSGACGFLKGGGLFFDTKYVGVADYFVCLLNAYKNRYCLIDERFVFIDTGGTFTDRGGMAEMRNLDTERLDFERLRLHFGDAITLKQSVEHVRKQRNPWERSIKLPY